tara:strand:- start:867 stop:1226 length:360 start_codon:yes stop_codon:yes gene_type:complete
MASTTFSGPVTSTAGFVGDITGGITGDVQALSGAGAVNLTSLITEVTTTGTDALTLADGTSGQVKIVTMTVDGGVGTLTPATFANGTTLAFQDVGDTVTLVYTTAVGWVLASNVGVTLA